MPEYPDLELYLESLRKRVLGKTLLQSVLKDPFVLRSVEPPLSRLEGKTCVGLSRMGKRLVLSFEGDLHLVIHLMIAGRLQWKQGKHPANHLLSWQFSDGWLALTEAGSKRRAKVLLVQDEQALRMHDPGGIEVHSVDLKTFSEQLRLRRHTLKRALTDPTLFAAIGNAYSDEILLAARLSPVRLTTSLHDSEVEQLYVVIRDLLTDWKQRLISEWGADWPTKVTAFHPAMAAHGKYLQPCPQCQSPIQRIRYADNETNYCAECQTGGRLLADRSLSRLLKQDWPRSLDELEELRAK
jgi:formamidopyrimidine-DNA glycosylase